MDKETLQLQLNTNTFGQSLTCYEEIDSTNSCLLEQLSNHCLPDGMVLVAKRQTAGRGTGGKRWESSNSESLLMSLLLQTPLRQQPLSFLPAIALVRTLRGFDGIDAHLKWPNDVLVGTRKLAGILCESATQPNQQQAWVVGVGINVNQRQFPDSLQNVAISMRQITGKSYPIERLFQDYLLEMEQLYYSPQDLVQSWLMHTKMIGKTITATKQGVLRRVKVVGLSAEGYLIVDNQHGEREVWMSSNQLHIDQDY